MCSSRRIWCVETPYAADIPCITKDFRVVDVVNHGSRPHVPEDEQFTIPASSKSLLTCIYNGRTSRATSAAGSSDMECTPLPGMWMFPVNGCGPLTRPFPERDYGRHLHGCHRQEL